jgi:hypothetical protein
MSAGNVNAQLELSPVGMGIQKVAQIVKYSDFTDGGGASGTLTLNKQIPAGSFVLGSKVTVKTGFTGDTTAVMDIGDGSDEDLFSYTTHNILAAAENLVEGCDSAAAGNTGTGIVPIAAATSVVLTVTGASDFGSITAGEMLVEVYYLSTNLELSNGYPRRVDL